MNTKIIIMANNKGGVGKTSSVAAIGDVLARKLGRKVLLIDADPQGNLSRRFGYSVSAPVDTTLEVFLQSEYDARKSGQPNSFSPSLFFNEATLKKPHSEVVSKYENLRIICSTPELQSVYETFHNDTNRAGSIIRRFMFNLKSSGVFDYVIIDTSPSLSYVLGQFLIGSDYLMVPLPPSEDAMDGAERVLNAFNLAADDKRDYEYKELRFLGFFFCNIAEKGIADRIYRQNRGEYWEEDTFFEATVPKSTAVLNAENKGAPVTSVFPSSPASWGYQKLAREIEARIKEFEEGVRS